MEHSFWKKILLLKHTLRCQRSDSSSSAIFQEGDSRNESQMIHSERLRNGKDYVVVDCGSTSLPHPHSSVYCPECANVASLSSDEDDERSSSSSVSSESSISGIHRCRWHQRHHNLKRNMIRLLVLILIIILVSTFLVVGLTLFSWLFYAHSLPLGGVVSGSGNISELLNFDSSADLSDISEASSAGSDDRSESESNYFHHTYNVEKGSFSVRPEGGKRKKLSSAEKIEISRKTWELLNRNSAKGQAGEEDLEPENRIDRIPAVPGPRHGNPPRFPPGRSGGGVILPAVMVYAGSSSDDGDEKLSEGSVIGQGQLVNNYVSFKNSNTSRKNCCRSRKYIQTLQMEGCEPLKISNRICLGECVSVWVPGVFSSFPACRPSRSHWKAVTFTCGVNRDKKKRVKVEKIRRCSCMDAST